MVSSQVASAAGGRKPRTVDTDAMVEADARKGYCEGAIILSLVTSYGGQSHCG
jgi:hypothetical protein